MTTITIKPRRNEEVICWKVDATDAAPNTQIEIEGKMTAIISIDGEMHVQMGGTKSIFSHFNPGKTRKMIGGNKPYKKIQIYALDQSNEFLAEWGLAGDTAMPCHDRELDVDCNAVAFGTYAYRVENFINFVNTCLTGDDAELTRDDLREMLRGEVAAIAKSVLTQKLAIGDIRACSMHLTEFADEIKEQINKRLDSKGMTVYSFVIEKLDYDNQHKMIKGVFTGAELDLKLGKIKKEGALDDLDVESKATEIGNTRIRAIKGTDSAAAKAAALPEKKAADALPAAHTIVCPRCGESNTNSNYCNKCGEKLVK